MTATITNITGKKMNASDAGSVCERKFAPLDMRRIDHKGCFEGYAGLFDRKDMSGDIIERGAFAASLRKRGAAGVRMLFQHDAAEPIGRWEELREDRRGLFVRGRLNLDVARAREVLSLMREGALDGLSIGFRTIRSRKGRGVRHLLEIDLWEISIVTFPMQPGARVLRVKGGSLPTKRELERWLVRDAGLTRSGARALLGSGYESLIRKQDAANGRDERLAGAIRRATMMLKGETANERI
jgi:HK97 family phage prohead protease